MSERIPSDWRQALQSAGRLAAFALVGAVLAAWVTLSAVVVVSGLWDVAKRIAEPAPVQFGRGGDPIDGWASGVTKMLGVLALMVVAAFFGGHFGVRRARDTEAVIPMDRWPFRLLILGQFVLLWWVSYNGYATMTRGPAPPDSDAGLAVGVLSILLAGMVQWLGQPRIAGYLAVTGLLLSGLAWIGHGVDNSEHMAKFLQAIALLVFMLASGGWVWWLLAREFPNPYPLQDGAD